VRVSVTSTTTGAFPSSFFEAGMRYRILFGAPGLSTRGGRLSADTSKTSEAQFETHQHFKELPADWAALFDDLELHLMQQVLDQQGEILASEVRGEGVGTELDLRYRIEGVDGHLSVSLVMESDGQPATIRVQLLETVQ
jgi:hypothetical protein